MNQLELMQSISKYFARFSEQIKILNVNNEFSINIHAENLLVSVLNTVYDLKLRNLNQLDSGNYSAIDLLDNQSSKRVSFQITSTNSIEKVKDCIQKYFRNTIYKEANHLNLYILTTKQKSYSTDAIQKKIGEEIDLLVQKREIEHKDDIDFNFDPSVNILDKRDLYRKLNADNDLDKIIRLEGLLKKQFGIIEEKDELANYYRRLKNMFYDTVMDDENGMTLDQIYTEPSFSIIHSAFKKDDTRFTTKIKEKFYDADSRYKIHEFVEDTLNGKNPLEFSKLHRLILILGYPGQGKSSFCKKVLNDYISKDKMKKKSVFYFQLRNIRQVREFIYNPLTVLYDEASSITEQNLDRFEFNKSFLILDGLDELYMRDNLKLEEIDRLCIELVRLLEKFSEMQIILTSRYGYVDDEKLTKENILIVQLSPFTYSLQLEWVSKYHIFHPETWLSEDKLRIFNSEHRFRHIRELVMQPLLLHMIASIKSEIDENTNRAKIYRQLFSELIDRKYAREGQLEILQNIKKEDLRDLIREVAFSIFQTGNEYITKTDLMKLNATQSFLKLLPETNFRDSIKGVMISFYFKEIEKTKEDELNEDRSNFAIEFLHKSLREYMTAEKIFYSIIEQFLDKRTSGKYVVDDAKTSLFVLNEIFGKQDLSSEIKFHLWEIVNNATKLNKEELVERMCLFLPDFVSSDFLIEYRMGHDKNCIDISLRCFYGFWYFISCLQLKKNYLSTAIIKQRISDYLRFLSNSEMSDIISFDLSHQDLSTESLTNVSFFGCVFNETNLSECELVGVSFNSCKFDNVNFSSAFFSATIFSLCKVKKCSLKDSYIENTRILNSEFEDIDFSLSEISGLSINQYKYPANDEESKMKMSECKFNGAKIDKISLEKLRQWYPEIDQQTFTELTDEEEDDGATEEPQRADEIITPDNYKRLILDDNPELKIAKSASN